MMNISARHTSVKQHPSGRVHTCAQRLQRRTGPPRTGRAPAPLRKPYFAALLLLPRPPEANSLAHPILCIANLSCAATLSCAAPTYISCAATPTRAATLSFAATVRRHPSCTTTLTCAAPVSPLPLLLRRTATLLSSCLTKRASAFFHPKLSNLQGIAGSLAAAAAALCTTSSWLSLVCERSQQLVRKTRPKPAVAPAPERAAEAPSRSLLRAAYM